MDFVPLFFVLCGMKIGLDAKRAFCTTAGLGQYARNHIRMLLQHAPENEYVLFSPYVRHQDFLEEVQAFSNVRIVLNESGLPHWYWRSYRSGKLASEMKLDLFHGLSNELPNGLNMPACVTLHDLIPFYDENFTPIHQLWAYRTKMKFAVKSASKVVCVSRFTRHQVLEKFPDVESRLEVIPPVVQTEFQSASFPASYPFGNKPYVLYLGTLAVRKNLGNLLEAMKMLSGRGGGFALVLAGKKVWFTDSLLEYSRNMQLENCVHFTGEISEAEKAAYIMHAQGLVYPSFIEGFGLPVVEALAAGKNVAVSSNTAMEEAAGDFGFRFNPQEPAEIAEALEQLVLHPTVDEHRKNLHLKQFAPETLIDSWTDCYASCLQLKNTLA